MGYESDIDSDMPGPTEGPINSSERLSPYPSLSQSLTSELNWFCKRYLIAFFAFLGFANIYAMRVNLSVAIVAMTNNYTIHGSSSSMLVPAEFNWDRQTQGRILSSFFYGYIFTQIGGGWLTYKFGGVRLFGFGVLTTAVLTLLTPLAAKAHIYLLVATRVLEGIFEGVTYPAILGVWSRWAPPCERSRLLSITVSGSYFGTVAAMTLSGAIAQHLNWAAIFYICGIIALFWCFLWFFFVRESPNHDPWVSEAEKNYIQESIGLSDRTKLLVVPWRCLLTSAPVWAIVIAHFSTNWGFYTLLTELPTFLDDSFHMRIMKENIVASLPYLVMGIVVQCSGFLADWLRSTGYLSTMQVRKIFTCAGFLGQTLFLIATVHSPNALLTILSLNISVGFGGLGWSGFGVNTLDIAPQYASIIVGLSNTAATIPGIISPMLTGYITKDKMPEEWRMVFYLSAGFYLLGAAGYGLLASGKVQPWAYSSDERAAILSDHSSSEDLLTTRDYRTTSE